MGFVKAELTPVNKLEGEQISAKPGRGLAVTDLADHGRDENLVDFSVFTW